MANDIDRYFAARADEEDELAASSTHPLVKATHERFAAAYRAHRTAIPKRHSYETNVRAMDFYS